MLISLAQFSEAIHCIIFGSVSKNYYARSLDSVNRTRKEHAMNFLFHFFINVSCTPSHPISFFYIVYGHATIRPLAYKASTTSETPQ